jgi:hypothetical protein
MFNSFGRMCHTTKTITSMNDIENLDIITSLEHAELEELVQTHNDRIKAVAPAAKSGATACTSLKRQREDTDRISRQHIPSQEGPARLKTTTGGAYSSIQMAAVEPTASHQARPGSLMELLAQQPPSMELDGRQEREEHADSRGLPLQPLSHNNSGELKVVTAVERRSERSTSPHDHVALIADSSSNHSHESQGHLVLPLSPVFVATAEDWWRSAKWFTQHPPEHDQCPE